MKDRLANINYTSLSKRVLLLILPIVLMPLGICFYYACGLGANPFSIFVDGEHVITGLTHGVASNYNNVVFFIFMLIFGRKHMGLGTVLSLLTMGTLIDLFNAMLNTAFPADERTLALRVAFLALGCLIFAVAVGLFISIGFGVSAQEFLTLFIAEKTGGSLKYIRIGIDAFWVTVGYFMGGNLGIGTVVGVLLTGPISVWVLKRTKAPFHRWFGPLYKDTAKAE